MKTDVVMKSENRVVCQTQDGTTFEFSGNPKTGIQAPWVRLAAGEKHLHVHVESACGHLLTPGAVLSMNRPKRRWWILLAAAAGFSAGIAACWRFEEIKAFLQSFAN